LEQVQQVLQQLQIDHQLEYELLRLKFTDTTISAEVERIAEQTDNSKYRVREDYREMSRKDLEVEKEIITLIDDYIKKIG